MVWTWVDSNSLNNLRSSRHQTPSDLWTLHLLNHNNPAQICSVACRWLNHKLRHPNSSNQPSHPPTGIHSARLPPSHSHLHLLSPLVAIPLGTHFSLHHLSNNSNQLCKPLLRNRRLPFKHPLRRVMASVVAYLTLIRWRKIKQSFKKLRRKNRTSLETKIRIYCILDKTIPSTACGAHKCSNALPWISTWVAISQHSALLRKTTWCKAKDRVMATQWVDLVACLDSSPNSHSRTWCLASNSNLWEWIWEETSWASSRWVASQWEVCSSSSSQICSARWICRLRSSKTNSRSRRVGSASCDHD